MQQSEPNIPLVVAGLTTVMLVGLFGTTAAAFDAGDFERERTSDAHEWDWPAVSEFQKRWQRVDDAAPVRVAVGDVRLTGGIEGDSDDDVVADEELLDLDEDAGIVLEEFDHSLVSIVDRGDAVALGAVQGPDPDQSRSFQRFFRGLDDAEWIEGQGEGSEADRLVFRTGNREVLTIEADHVSEAAEIRDDDWSDHVYTETLFGFGDSVYEDPPEDGEDESDDRESLFGGSVGTSLSDDVERRLEDDDPEVRREAVDELLARPIGPRDGVWRDVLDKLETGEDDELKRRVHARYRPVGSCSVDSTPQDTAREYSEVCRRLGDLGCFFKLRLRVVNNAFRRTAYSTAGARAHEPASEGFRSAPVDVRRLVRGLVLEYATDGVPGFWISPGRLAEIVDEEYDEMIDELVAMAADERLDAFNRLNATRVAYFAARGPQPEEDDETLIERIEQTSLTPAARHWVEQNEEHR